MLDFQTSYDRLNLGQRKAVDALYGSYMIVAGPGTGKTQVLSLRTARILLSTDTQPENILITTFTDAGVRAIRARLTLFMGATSYRVEVTTLHSLSDTIIRAYPEYFLKYRAFQALDDFEVLSQIENLLAQGDFEILFPIHAPKFWVKEVSTAIGKLQME